MHQEKQQTEAEQEVQVDELVDELEEEKHVDSKAFTIGEDGL